MLASPNPTIALVGDYSDQVVAHRAIPVALEKAAHDLGVAAAWTWVSTRDVAQPSRDLRQFAAAWIVPGSPYENMAGVLGAVRWMRETHRPILGTCGGFQHMLIEIARNLAGLAEADHAETQPGGRCLVISRLARSLVGNTGLLRFAPGSQIRQAYGSESATETYHCNFGLDATYAGILERAGLRFTAHDQNREIRAAELPVNVHPFFIGTLFQPERAALRGETPALVRAFVQAVAACP